MQVTGAFNSCTEVLLIVKSGLLQRSHVVCIVLYACNVILIWLRRASISGILTAALSERSMVCVHADEDEHIAIYLNRHIQFNG